MHFVHFLAFFLAVVTSAETQELQGLSPPIRPTSVLADLEIEDPPVYSGMQSAPAPATGEIIQIQIFVPEAAGKQAYGYIVEFEHADSTFQDYFQINKAEALTESIQLDPQGRILNQTLFRQDMPAPRGSRGPGRSTLFVARPTVPTNGLIATFTLEALKDVPTAIPLEFTVSTAIYATTSPARIWHLTGTGRIFWQ